MDKSQREAYSAPATYTVVTWDRDAAGKVTELSREPFEGREEAYKRVLWARYCGLNAEVQS